MSSRLSLRELAAALEEILHLPGRRDPPQSVLVVLTWCTTWIGGTTSWWLTLRVSWATSVDQRLQHGPVWQSASEAGSLQDQEQGFAGWKARRKPRRFGRKPMGRNRCPICECEQWSSQCSRGGGTGHPRIRKLLLSDPSMRTAASRWRPTSEPRKIAALFARLLNGLGGIRPRWLEGLAPTVPQAVEALPLRSGARQSLHESWWIRLP